MIRAPTATQPVTGYVGIQTQALSALLRIICRNMIESELGRVGMR